MLTNYGSARVKKIDKGTEIGSLKRFRRTNGNLSWKSFRDFKAGGVSIYSLVKQKKMDLQNFICAYCEKKLPADLSKIVLEHVIDKSNNSVAYSKKRTKKKRFKEYNYTYAWDNIVVVCNGGNDQDPTIEELDRLHCDQFKSHIKKKGESAESLKYFINPHNLKPKKNFYTIDRCTGDISANSAMCNNEMHNGIELYEAIDKTIEKLNLNIKKLSRQRLEYYTFFESKRETARINSDKNYKKRLTAQWLDANDISFFTTKRYILGQEADNYLSSQNKIIY